MSRYSVLDVQFKDIYPTLVNEGEWKETWLPKKGLFKVVYGFDHATFYFVQFYPIDEAAKKETKRVTNRTECFNIDTISHGLKGIQLGFLLKIINADEAHAIACVLDSQF